MPLFIKTEAELETHFDKWIYFLKKLETFDDIPAILREPIFEKAFSVAEISNFSPLQRDQYEENRLNYLGLKAAMDTAESDGIKKGEITGIIKGKMEEKFDVVKECWLEGVSASLASKLTKLTIEEVEQLYKQFDPQKKQN